jgi:hypothetical protein
MGGEHTVAKRHSEFSGRAPKMGSSQESQTTIPLSDETYESTLLITLRIFKI